MDNGGSEDFDSDNEKVPDVYWDKDEGDYSGGEGLIRISELESHFQVAEAYLLSNEWKNQQRGLWDSIPDEILGMILMRLPIAARCRARAVCTRWEELLSSPLKKQIGSQMESISPCTVMYYRHPTDGNFFCHTEERWYRMPFLPKKCLGLRWMLRVTDKGIVCYQAYVKGKSWLLVSNPLNLSCQVIPPEYPTAKRRSKRHPFDYFRPKVVGFSVNQETESFRVIVLHDGAAMLFDSKTQGWKYCKEVPAGAHEGTEALWHNMTYKEGLGGRHLAFDMQLGMWSKVKLNIPRFIYGEDLHCIITSKEHVMAFQYQSEDDAINMWSLLDATSPQTSLALQWQKVEINVPTAIRPLLEHFEYCWIFGGDFVYFSSCQSAQWMEYALETKTWRMMPLVRWNRCDSLLRNHSAIKYKWLGWEPSLQMEVQSVAFSIENYPDLQGPLVEYGSEGESTSEWSDDGSMSEGSDDSEDDEDHDEGNDSDDSGSLEGD